MSGLHLTSLNAILNFISLVLLIIGYSEIKKGNRTKHKKLMISAVIVSGLFLISYMLYHYQVGSVLYPRHDWSRYMYFAFLIPHIVLAAVIVPAIFTALYFAFKRKFIQHKKVTKGLFPVWIFVSISGIIVYLMLYQFA